MTRDAVLASSPEIIASPVEADEDVAAGRTFFHTDVFAHLDDEEAKPGKSAA